MSEAQLTGGERVFCPFFDGRVLEISNRLWLPTLTDFADQPSHWSVGYFKNVVPTSWFTIQMWNHRRQNSPTSSSQPSRCLSADSMDDVRINIGPTDAQLTKEQMQAKKEMAQKRKEEKKRKAEEKALSSKKPKKDKTPVQLQREAAALAKHAERERKAAEKEEQKITRKFVRDNYTNCSNL